jgi:hypothetical protein
MPSFTKVTVTGTICTFQLMQVRIVRVVVPVVELKKEGVLLGEILHGPLSLRTSRNRPDPRIRIIFPVRELLHLLNEVVIVSKVDLEVPPSVFDFFNHLLLVRPIRTASPSPPPSRPPPSGVFVMRGPWRELDFSSLGTLVEK